MSEEGEHLVEVLNHPSWLTFSRNVLNDHNSSRVVSYINIRLLQFHFSLQRDIFNHNNILCVLFFNNSFIYYLINIYSNFSQTALKDTEANISNILILAGDFNIRDSSWNLSFPHYSVYSDLLNDIADSITLYRSKAPNFVPTRYSDNQNDSNLVIDLIFLHPNSLELNNHMIYPEWRLSSDHMPLMVNIAIIKEYIQTKKCIIVKNSKEEKNFINKLIEIIKCLDIEQISNKEILE